MKFNSYLTLIPSQLVKNNLHNLKSLATSPNNQLHMEIKNKNKIN
jgi:hypothetical protein